MSYSKRKGKRLEDEVAEIIRKKYNVDDKYIKRAGSSGVRVEESGDIDIIHPEIEKQFPFVIECKNNEKWKLRDLIGAGKSNKSNPFKQFIKQNAKDVSKRKYGLIVFSKNYEDIYGLYYCKEKDSIYKKIDKLIDSKIITQLDEYNLIVFEFKEFVKKW